MEKIYSLQIHIKGASMRDLEEILELDKYKDLKWENEVNLDRGLFSFEVKEYKKDDYFPYVDFFLGLLRGKYDELNDRLGASRSDISIKYKYGYDEQCNMEWDPSDLKSLGDNQIDLHIACWRIPRSSPLYQK